MQKSRKISIALASCLAVAISSTAVVAAEGGAPAAQEKKPSLSESPYKNGPPPITGGYTDTSQGGTKGSGDMQALPPGVGKNPAAPPAGDPTPQGTPSGR